jgi:hypothetical protein
MRVNDYVKVISPTNKLHGERGLITQIDPELGYVVVKFTKKVDSELEDGYGWMFLIRELAEIDYRDNIPNPDYLKHLALEICHIKYAKAIEVISERLVMEARYGNNRVNLEDIVFNFFDNTEVPSFVKHVFTITSCGMYKWTTENKAGRYYDVIYWDW